MLFDDTERTETRTKLDREPIFAYLNLSARAPLTAARQVLEKWFERYPESGKDDLRARFRSPIDGQHQSAFWELYLHELFSGMGYALEPHPDIELSANHPDFLIKRDGVPAFYLEAIVAGLPSVREAGAEARLAEVFDLVNKLKALDWFLQVEHRGLPDTPPPVKSLRIELEKWLAGLDRPAIEESLKAEDWERLPRFEWTHDGLTLSFTASPTSERTAGDQNARPIGIRMGEAHLIETDNDIRHAVEVKAKKYGELNLPLVVAVNVVGEHCDETDIFNALFGTETILATRTPAGTFAESGKRLPDGVWFGKKGPRNKTVSAVLVVGNIDVYFCGEKPLLLVHNPYARRHLDEPSYPLAQSVPNEESQRMEKKEGKPPKEYLRLPETWPPVND
jgi:hypothetical protein